ncbi:hypothetical protein WA026_009085 [Henosepilachna vigintioctopunctata]|uniref:Uncharacterized protein n=1 Tax=Henosepilachna vigintioctopunctata TaxID=420089 RepID=A0AAW1UUP9_9CUCU
MKFFTCITLALCVALAAADSKETTKTKRYAPFLPNGIESKFSYNSIPYSHEYSNLNRIYSGVSPSVYSSYGYGNVYPSVYSSGLGLSGLSSVGVNGYSSLIGSGLAKSVVSGSSLVNSGLYGSSYAVPAMYSNLASLGLGYGYGAGYTSSFGVPKVFHGPIKEAGTTQNVQYRTVTQHVPVPVPQPYPVEVTKQVSVPQPYPVHVPKAVPVPVKVEVPVEVPRPYTVRVPQPVPVHVPVKVPVEIPRPYPVTVTKTVQVPVEKPIYVKYPVQYPVHVPEPYPVEVPQPVPVKVPHPVVVKVPHYQVTKSTAYVQPSVNVVASSLPASYVSGVEAAAYNPSWVASSGASAFYPASYSAGVKYSSSVPSFTSGAVFPVDSHAVSYSNGLTSVGSVGGVSYNGLIAGGSVYPYNFNSNLYGKYLSGEKHYINAQPMNYLSGYNNYGLLKSYIPSIYGGYNGLKSYSTEHWGKKK